MRAFICKCKECLNEKDRIFRANEIVKCDKPDCGGTMERQGGPIGGSDILALSPGQPDRFVMFQSASLRKSIDTPEKMLKAYEEMYGQHPPEESVPVKEPSSGHVKSGEYVHEGRNVFPSKRPGRPRKNV